MIQNSYGCNIIREKYKVFDGTIRKRSEDHRIEMIKKGGAKENLHKVLKRVVVNVF